MKKIIIVVFTFASLFSFGQTQTELSNILSASQKDFFVTGASLQNTLNNNILLSTAGASGLDAMTGTTISYRSFYCQVTGNSGITGGAVIFEGSNNNLAYTPLTVYDDAIFTGTPITGAITIAANTNRFFSGKISYKFIRCRISTAFAGGTVNALTRFSTSDYIPRIFTIGNPTAANLLTNASQSGTWTMQPGNTANTTAWLVEQRTGTTNASTSTAINSAATTNATLLKSTAGMVYGIYSMNTSAATRYIRLYNLTTAPTVGTSVPVLVIAVPGGTSQPLPIPSGLRFTTGISCSITAGVSVLDATATAAGDVQLLINFQ
jgi:hypothetical protein